MNCRNIEDVCRYAILSVLGVVIVVALVVWWKATLSLLAVVALVIAVLFVGSWLMGEIRICKEKDDD